MPVVRKKMRKERERGEGGKRGKEKEKNRKKQSASVAREELVRSKGWEGRGRLHRGSVSPLAGPGGRTDRQ